MTYPCPIVRGKARSSQEFDKAESVIRVPYSTQPVPFVMSQVVEKQADKTDLGGEQVSRE